MNFEGGGFRVEFVICVAFFHPVKPFHYFMLLASETKCSVTQKVNNLNIMVF
jgi:hypothetical protein